MNRQQVVIAIAKINKIIQQVSYYLDLGTAIEEVDKRTDMDSVPNLCTSVLEFMHLSPCQSIAEYVTNMRHTDYIEGKLQDNFNNYPLGIIKSLKKMVAAVKSLLQYAEEYMEIIQEGEERHLINELRSEKSIALFQRAVDAGMLDEFYQPKGLSCIQKKLLAYAIGKMLGLKKRNFWTTFEKQWKCSRLSTVKNPEMRLDSCKSIESLYPEVDFNQLWIIDSAAYFSIDCTRKQKEQLFLSLIAHNYIDKTTTFANFEAIFHFRDLNESFEPINWLAGTSHLSYLCYLSFGQAKGVWESVRCCFRLKGKHPNHGTLMSSLCTIKRTGQLETYDPFLYHIAEQFTRP